VHPDGSHNALPVSYILDLYTGTVLTFFLLKAEEEQKIKEKVEQLNREAEEELKRIQEAARQQAEECSDMIFRLTLKQL
jgi:hypothetical protein